MKKLILIALAFVSLQAVAQDKQKSERKTKADHMQNMTAEEQATILTKKLTLSLDLDEKQQSQVKEIMLEQANMRKKKMAQKENKSKEIKISRAESINEKLDHQIEVKQQMKTILNKEQYKKWSDMQERRHTKTKQKNIMTSNN
jgi:hypothetical protein